MTNNNSRRDEELRECTLEELIERYWNAAAQRGKAFLRNDSKTANRMFEETDRLWDELTHRDSTDALRSLLSDEDPGVRLSAAGRLLENYPEPASRVLR